MWVRLPSQSVPWCFGIFYTGMVGIDMCWCSIKWMPKGGRFFINSVGKSPENHKQECKSLGNIATAAVIACSTNNAVIHTASDSSCGEGLGTRLQVMHKRSRICQFAHWHWTNFFKNVSAMSDVAGPEKQWIYLPQPYLVQLHIHRQLLRS